MPKAKDTIKPSKPAAPPPKSVVKTASPRSGKAANEPAAPKADARSPQPAAAKLSPEDVYRLIQESAYFKAKARGFAPGHEVQDWIEAEAEVRNRLGART